VFALKGTELAVYCDGVCTRGRAEGDDLKEVTDTKYCYGNSGEQMNVRLRNRNLVMGCVQGTAERYKLSPGGNSEVKFCCS
jgi:hypothetical protein